MRADRVARQKRDQHILQLYVAGLPIPEISAAAHLTRQQVHNILTKLGVEKNRPRGPAPDTRRHVEMVELRMQGISCEHIAQLHNTTPSFVSFITRTRAPSLNISAQRQQRVEKALELRRQGLTAKAIATQMGVSIGTVFRYMSGASDD